jgi:trehalose/maltose hydrolase-like predicted phosphorylase
MNEWKLSYKGWNPQNEPLREALCTLGNGYFATRGAGEESTAGDVHYPGTYIAGVYNRLETQIAGSSLLMNNAYTNVMAAWMLCGTRSVLELLANECREELLAGLQVSDEGIVRAGKISAVRCWCLSSTAVSWLSSRATTSSRISIGKPIAKGTTTFKDSIAF